MQTTEHPTQAIVSAYKSKDYAACVTLADERLRKEPDDIVACQLRAYSLAFLNRNDEAIEAYREAIEVLEKVVKTDKRVEALRGDLWFNLSCELANKGRVKEAIGTLSQAIKYKPECAEKAQANGYWAKHAEVPDFRVLVGLPPLAGSKTSDTKLAALSPADIKKLERIIKEDNAEFFEKLFTKSLFASWIVSRKDQQPLLFTAIEEEAEQIIAFLLDEEADPNEEWETENEEVWTPLLFAIEYENEAAVEQLLSRDADPDMEGDVGTGGDDSDPVTPLMLAERNEQTKIVKLLKKAGATRSSIEGV